LRDSGLQGQSLWLSLFGFNLGVEIGQLGVVGLVWPLAWRMRSALSVRQFGVTAVSLLLAVIGSILLIERALDVSIL
jgi:hypothetical protein